MFLDISLVQTNARGLDHQPAALGHGVAHALATRFTRICSICTGSAFTLPSFLPGINTSSISSPIRRGYILLMSSMIRFRSRSCRDCICFEKKVLPANDANDGEPNWFRVVGQLEKGWSTPSGLHNSLVCAPGFSTQAPQRLKPPRGTTFLWSAKARLHPKSADHI